MSSLGRRAFKPIYLLYYRLLFGRRFPGAAALQRCVHAWEGATGRGDAPASRQQWESQYGAGSWEFMLELDERARYAVIGAYVHRLRPGGAVLDVGCGEGLLAEQLRPLDYARYLGVDLAAAAIAQAAARADGRTVFVAADAESYTPPARFDVVVFNESVYYFREPLASVARYEEFLAPGGLFIVSTFRSHRADAIARLLQRRYRTLEATTVSNRKGSWVIRVLEPAGDAQQHPSGPQQA